MGMKKRRNHKRNRGACVCSALGTLLLTVVILLCIPLTIPRLFGFQIYTVVSGSMAPAIPTGSLVYVEEVDAADVETDDVIVFYSGSESGGIITHRVVKNQVVSGQFITKGDANEQEDVTPVEYDRLIGKVVFSVPVLGSILAAVAGTSGKIAAAGMIVAAVLLHMAAGRLREEE